MRRTVCAEVARPSGVMVVLAFDLTDPFEVEAVGQVWRLDPLGFGLEGNGCGALHRICLLVGCGLDDVDSASFVRCRALESHGLEVVDLCLYERDLGQAGVRSVPMPVRDALWAECAGRSRVGYVVTFDQSPAFVYDSIGEVDRFVSLVSGFEEDRCGCSHRLNFLEGQGPLCPWLGDVHPMEPATIPSRLLPV